MKAIVVGRGLIGSNLMQILKGRGHSVVCSANSKAVFDSRGNPTHTGKRLHLTPRELQLGLEPFFERANALFLAIPTKDQGKNAIAIIHSARKGELFVSTCEKGSQAFGYAAIKRYISDGTLGNSATVGGGSDILHALKRRRLENEQVTLYLVINGTLNYIWSSNSFGAAVARARRLGYAEPNGTDRVGLVNGELWDVVLKSCVMYNDCLAPSDGPYLSPDMFYKHGGVPYHPVEGYSLHDLTDPTTRYRYMVTMTSVDKVVREKWNPGRHWKPGSIRARCGRWVISGDFVDISSRSNVDLWLEGVDEVNNGYLIHNAFGEDTGHRQSGPGAGADTTAMAMVREAEAYYG